MAFAMPAPVKLLITVPVALTLVTFCVDGPGEPPEPPFPLPLPPLTAKAEGAANAMAAVTSNRTGHLSRLSLRLEAVH